MVRAEESTTRQRRFTLIEVLVAVAILGLLAAITVPVYQDQTASARRSDGHSLLRDIGARLERFYFDNTTYTRNLQALGFAVADHLPSAENHYTASVEAETSACPLTNCYRVTATPQGTQAQETYCGNLTLDSRGQKSISGSGDAAHCW